MRTRIYGRKGLTGRFEDELIDLLSMHDSTMYIYARSPTIFEVFEWIFIEFVISLYPLSRLKSSLDGPMSNIDFLDPPILRPQPTHRQPSPHYHPSHFRGTFHTHQAHS